MKILNKFIWSKKEPVNKNDVWFDGSVFNLYKENKWEAFTLPIDAVEKVAEVIKNASNVYQEKLIAGKGVSIKDNIISISTLFQIVNTLPSVGEENTIYLIFNTEKENNSFKEYVYINGNWEQLGEFKTEIDLSGYISRIEAEDTYYTRKQASIDLLKKADKESVETSLKEKQNIIKDLEDIRKGASKGETAIQQVKTINNQSILGEGNIEIKGGGGSSIDDEAIQGALAERNVGSVDAFGELEDPNVPSGGYDDTEIRNELTELSSEVEEINEKIGNLPQGASMTPITYAELVELRDNGKLVAGAFYRITDYITTTAQENTHSANHPFDVIVLALSENTLAEEAYAFQSARDTDGYFANSNLSAWKIWYCLDNDAERFAWADVENGKGVIYRMIDEFENDIPYDFKNIQFRRKISLDEGYPQFSEEAEETWVYTFCANSYHINNDEWSELKDGSLESPYGHMSDENSSTFHHNSMKPWFMYYNGNDIYQECGKAYLNDNVFLGYWEEIGSGNEEEMPYYYAYCCFGNTFGNNCNYNTFGNNCNSNSFGNGCYSNSFGNSCNYNSFGNNCYSNSFGNDCYSNSFGSDCYYNSFGNNCNYNSFGNNCYSNSFGDDCYSNSFGNNCNSNSFGNDCYSNSFGNLSQSNELRGYYCFITFGEGVQYTILENDTSGANDRQVQNYRIANGVQGNYRKKIIFFVERGKHPEVIFDVNSDGDTVEICLANSSISTVQ